MRATVWIAYLVAFGIVTLVAIASLFSIIFRERPFLARRYYRNERLTLLSANPLETIQTLNLVRAHGDEVGDIWTSRLARIAAVSHLVWYGMAIPLILISVVQAL